MFDKKSQSNKSDSYWIKKNRYYYKRLARFYSFIIPEGKRVLQVGCKSGYLLNSVKPVFGLGIDTNEEYISEAKRIYPDLYFECCSIKELKEKKKYLDNKFDYIILSHTLMYEYDVQLFLEDLKFVCSSKTRVIANICSGLWEPFLKVGQFLGFRRNVSFKNWLQMSDLENFFNLVSYGIINKYYRTLFPKYIPLVSSFLNFILSNIPIICRASLDLFIVAKLKPEILENFNLSCSVIVTCKNEAGNISNVMKRMPKLGKKTEVIFVEGGSTDNSLQEIEKVISEYKNDSFFSVKLLMQDGKGKGDAVRKGFSNASGDVLMILDGDLAVPPEELIKFWNAILQGKGEFINGVRLIYAMESGAMRILNLIANKMFSLGFTWLLGQRIRDTLCGTKVLFKNDWQKIEGNRLFFGEFDPFGDFDLIFGAVKQNLKLIDMPIHYKSRVYGFTQISRFKHGLLLLKMSWVAFVKFRWI